MIEKLARLLVEILLPELRALRLALTQIAAGLEEHNARQRPPVLPTPSEDNPLVQVSYVNDQVQQEWMDVELSLTKSKGIPPSEDEILAEWERRHQDQGDVL